jgi:hypothetical protein
MLDPKQVKKFEKIIKKLLVARADSSRRDLALQGFEYITGEFGDEGEYTARITATNGHILFRYYMSPDEREHFERCELPRYFSNGENVFFTTKSDANENVKYPDVDIMMPKDTFDISIPVYFDPRNSVKACDFLSAAVGRTIPTFYPQFSTNAKEPYTGHLCGPTVEVRGNATALMMPLRMPPREEPQNEMAEMAEMAA